MIQKLDSKKNFLNQSILRSKSMIDQYEKSLKNLENNNIKSKYSE